LHADQDIHAAAWTAGDTDHNFTPAIAELGNRWSRGRSSLTSSQSSSPAGDGAWQRGYLSLQVQDDTMLFWPKINNVERLRFKTCE
jgi:hypothetical protein